jgi:sulfhydrogenase subunit beta (sulfur reductase)
VSGEPSGDWWAMRAGDLHRFVSLLESEFDEVIGPVVEDGVIRLRPIRSADELPTGVTEQQETASYRLLDTGTPLRFSYGLGPDSLKSIVHPPRSPVWTMRRSDGSLIVDQTLHGTTTRAVIGVRACDLQGLAVLERTQTGGQHADPAFAAHRQGLFLVAIDCTHPAPTCFCDTAGEGPVADDGYDLALTELDDPNGVAYVVRAGTDRGRSLVETLELRPASRVRLTQRRRQLDSTSRAFIRELPDNAADVVALVDHEHWSDVAERCLTCGNCTAVCPTCFCTDMEDVVGLDGETATRTRVWDTCFSMEYSRLGATPHRATPTARYRQWLSHKLGTWHNQFGESGCVGCGRCITWCPVGIDLTAEVESLGRPIEVMS